VARIEENQKFLINNMNNLPQSPKCVDEIVELRKDIITLNKFKDDLNKKVAYVGGVIMAVSFAIPHFVSWLISHIHWKTP
jgi:hypothetical protein